MLAKLAALKKRFERKKDAAPASPQAKKKLDLQAAVAAAGLADAYEFVGDGLGGSADARRAVKKATGETVVLKLRYSVRQCQNEVAATKLYAAMGAKVPTTKVVGTAAGKLLPILEQELVGGETLLALTEQKETDPAAAERVEAARGNLCSHFLLDCLLANWDVVGGRGGDNILVQADGSAYRVDNAGVLSIRAQGGPRLEWCGVVSELHVMRDAADGNKQCGNVFFDVTDDQIRDQFASLHSHLASCRGSEGRLLLGFTEADHEIFDERLRYVEQYLVHTEAVPAAALCPLPDEGLVEALREMGFAEEAARQALQNSHNNSDLAITLLTQES
ncbi:hypothetical protein DIPPA_05027 [Diplonema papillatum]|nr:hypothetical protein DIPPA_05027 [Diplonema papillatum]